MRKSILVAAALAIAAAGWILSGRFWPPASHNPESANALRLEAAAPLASVRVARLHAEPREKLVVVSGRTQASRRVDVRAETDGRIIEILVNKGDIVERGQILSRIDLAERRAKLAEAEARLRQRNIEYEAAAQLQSKGFRSDTSLAAAQARLEEAHTAVEQIRIDISRTTIRAPFSGVAAKNWAEMGAYVKIGDVAGTIVDLDPILVVGYASEREVGLLRHGALGSARLIDGSEIDGTIIFIAPTAEERTRTYRFELEVPNSDLSTRSGLTAELIVPVAQELSHLISPAVLTLADDGTVGVKVVDSSHTVQFMPVQIVGDSPEGILITGLPNEVLLITVGQEFVVGGQRVAPVEAAPSTVGAR